MTDDAFYISNPTRGEIAVGKQLDYETGPRNYTGIFLVVVSILRKKVTLTLFGDLLVYDVTSTGIYYTSFGQTASLRHAGSVKEVFCGAVLSSGFCS